MFNKIINKNTILIITMVLIALYPIIELDYLAYETLNSLNIPRINTIFKLIILPLLVLINFYLFEKNKKRVIIFTITYGILIGLYTIFYYLNASSLVPTLYLTDNFSFNIVDDILYFINLLLPLFYIYVVNVNDIKVDIVKKVVYLSSLVTALPIFISNIFVVSLSTYEGNTIDNIFSWFSLPFNDELNHPRLYASKFFFEEGNSISVLLFVILPLLYYFLYHENKKKNKIFVCSLILIHSLAMIMMSSRTATYGTILVPFTLLIAYIVLVILKQETIKKLFIIYTISIGILCSVILPYSPAYQNQLLDAKDHGFIILNNDQKDEAEEYRGEGESLEPYSEEWLNFYSYMFEAYSWMIGVTPPIYYTEWYNYKHDPKFWVDLIFDYELEERVSGRQVQEIFMNYKYESLTPTNKMFGLSYSSFMNGSIILEKDFHQQYLTLGYLGFILFMSPWLLICLYAAFKIIVGFKKGTYNLLNVSLMMSLALGIIGAYLSGHVIDELSSSLMIAFIAGTLIVRVNKNETK